MHRINYAIIAFCFLVAGASVHADQEIQEFQVIGEGVSYKDALHNALTNGISQIYGFSLDSEEVRQQTVREISSYVDGQTSSKGGIDVHSQGRIDFKTRGFVQNYEVLSKNINPDGFYEVTILAKIAKYVTPGISPESRRKIAIIPFRTQQPAYNFEGRRMPAAELARRFSQHMVTELTQSRRFTVLDREYTEEILREKNLILSPDSPVSEQAKIGQVLGVDYLLIGTVTEAMHECTPYRIVVSGETGRRCRAELAADYRIMVMATRQIKWADAIGFALTDAEIKGIGSSPSQVQDVLFSGAAKKIVAKALDNIYPLRIVQVQANGDLVINQGGSTLAAGEMLDIYNPGEKVIDPYTGESLGAAESWAATAKIIRVTPKMAYAEVVKGIAADVRVGGICRRSENKPAVEPPKSTSSKKTTVQALPGGGVVLPFD